MRNKLPVSNTEYVLADLETIVSKTDLMGNITYVNADFVRISGFSEAELLGAPQNIVRHPDMPREAFADFWRTIQSGKAWTGMVKNRCKNGDHYWVAATAAPIIKDGAITGYTSIRTKPDRAEVTAASRAYDLIRSGADGLSVRDGQVVTAKASRWAAWGSLSLNARLLFAGLLISCLFALMLVASLRSGTANAGVQLACAISGIALTAGVTVLIRRRVVRPLLALRHEIERMSSGDLSSRIRVLADGEIQTVTDSLRVLQTNIRLLIGQIREVTGIVRSGATEITQGTADLSARTES